MAEQHDRWLQGIGIDVESLLGRMPGSAPGLEYERPDSGEGYRRPAEGAGYRAPVQRGTQVEPFVGDVQGRDDGTVSGKGAVLTSTGGDEEGELLTGEFESGPDRNSAKVALARSRSRDGTFTQTVGEVEVTPQKVAVTGFKRERDFAKSSGGLLPDNVVIKGDAAVGTASAEASVNDDSIAVGAQANAAEGSLTLGTSGTKRDDGSDSDLDQTFRFGLSEGVGYAGRVHFGDADKDGNPEIGVGADFGFVSFDVKSEDPLRTGLGLMQASQGPIALLPATFGPGGTLDDENLTKKVGSPAEGVEAGRNLGGAASQIVGETVSEAKEALVDGVTGLLSGDDD